MTEQIIEIISASGRVLSWAEQDALRVAVPLLVGSGLMHQLPLEALDYSREAFIAGQSRIGIDNADTAKLLGVSESLVDKMRGGSVVPRPLIAFTLASCPRRVAMAHLARLDASDKP